MGTISEMQGSAYRSIRSRNAIEAGGGKQDPVACGEGIAPPAVRFKLNRDDHEVAFHPVVNRCGIVKGGGWRQVEPLEVFPIPFEGSRDPLQIAVRIEHQGDPDSVSL